MQLYTSIFCMRSYKLHQNVVSSYLRISCSLFKHGIQISAFVMKSIFENIEREYTEELM